MFQKPNSKTGSTLATLSCLNNLLLRGQRAGLSQPHTTRTTKKQSITWLKIYKPSCGWMQLSKVHLFQCKDKSFFPLTEREKRDFTQTQPEPERAESSSRGGGADANPWRAMCNWPGATHGRWGTALSEQRPQKVGSGRAVCTSCASANLRGNLFHYKR